jgi:hypothetical protein
MSAFGLVFSLAGLVLGLSLAEVLRGLTKAMKTRRKMRIGWLTPLLALLVCFDLTSFWTSAWELHDAIPPTWPALFLGFVITGTYYAAATMVFPDEPNEWESYDAYFFAHKRLVLGAVLTCNVIVLLIAVVMRGLPQPDLRAWLTQYSFFPLLVVAIAVKWRWLNLVLLSVLSALYPLGALMGALFPR